MKNLLKSTLFIATVFLFMSCSVEQIEMSDQSVENLQTFDSEDCSNQDPKSRIINNSDIAVDLDVYDANDILLVSVLGVLPNEISDWISFGAGEVTFVVNTNVTIKAISIDMGTCMIYEVTIDENYQLDTDQPIQL